MLHNQSRKRRFVAAAKGGQGYEIGGTCIHFRGSAGYPRGTLWRGSEQASTFNQAWALVPLRLMIGFGFAAHGYAKLAKGPEAFAMVLSSMGVPSPR